MKELLTMYTIPLAIMADVMVTAAVECVIFFFRRFFRMELVGEQFFILLLVKYDIVIGVHLKRI